MINQNPGQQSYDLVVKAQSERSWHCAMNTFDHNANMGPDTDISNFIFLDGFSGHGLQQSPAMGHGPAGRLFIKKAVI